MPEEKKKEPEMYPKDLIIRKLSKLFNDFLVPFIKPLGSEPFEETIMNAKRLQWVDLPLEDLKEFYDSLEKASLGLDK